MNLVVFDFKADIFLCKSCCFLGHIHRDIKSKKREERILLNWAAQSLVPSESHFKRVIGKLKLALNERPPNQEGHENQVILINLLINLRCIY